MGFSENDYSLSKYFLFILANFESFLFNKTISKSSEGIYEKMANFNNSWININ